MKKITAYIAALLIVCICMGSVFLAGCRKSDTSSAGILQINNITDLTIAQGSAATTPWIVTGNAAAQVSVAISGLPTGIAATITPATGIPTFNVAVAFVVDASVAAGTYPYTITANSSMGSKTYTGHITITAVAQCATTLTGLYIDNGPNPGNGTSPADSIRISTYAGKANSVTIDYIYQGAVVFEMYANLYCSQNSLYIPSQAVSDGAGGNYYLGGNGSFSSASITLNETMDGGITFITETFQRH